MIRAVLYLLLTVFLITLLRAVIGMIARAFSDMIQPGSAAKRETSQAPKPGGELKKDPVCGAFVPVTTSVKRTVKGEVVHFCSAVCRDKYQA
jgi:YHS domain-containing protein